MLVGEHVGLYVERCSLWGSVVCLWTMELCSLSAPAVHTIQAAANIAAPPPHNTVVPVLVFLAFGVRLRVSL